MISQCRKAIENTRRTSANDFAPELSSQLDANWNLLIKEWQQQNGKWFLKRDYSRLERIADHTRQLAVVTGEKAKTVQDSVRVCASNEIKALEKTFAKFDHSRQSVSNNLSESHRFVKGELILSESREAFKRGDYNKALALVRSAGSKINQTQQDVRKKVNNYLSRFPVWQDWVDQTLAFSRENHCAVIVVDKYAHFCYVYESGNLAEKYPAEFGPNWMAPKRRRGDRATPEGRYYVIGKKDTMKSRYYKALELDYPNAEDQQSFDAAKQKGTLTQNAEIGGLIEIHGDGGKGDDWTNGCVALRNEDMERLYQRICVGTPVTIVGSMKKVNWP